MRFMLSGRAVNRHGSPMVRSGVQRALTDLGHQTIVEQPRRGYGGWRIDYLVATQASIDRNVAKVQWARREGISVLTYPGMWGVIDQAQRLVESATTSNSLPDRTPSWAAADRGSEYEENPHDVAIHTQRRAEEAFQEAGVPTVDNGENWGSSHPMHHPRSDAASGDDAVTITPIMPDPPPIAPATPPRRRIVTRR